MIQIIYQRNKCIGCNYCINLAPNRWKMNNKDGKSVLLNSRYKKGFYIAEVPEKEYGVNKASAKVCPVKIIRVNKIKNNNTEMYI